MKKMLLTGLYIFCIFGITKTNAQVEIIQTVAGGGGSLGDGGLATAAQLNLNYFLALDGAGNLFLSDNGNNRVRRIDAVTGIITTVAGIGGAGGYTADGVAATTSKLNSPIGIALDASGNIYIGDQLNSRIRKVDGSTGIITTIAGTGTAGFTGDGTAATGAEINQPRGVAVDGSGNVYFSDGGATPTRIRMITASTGIITTIGGNGTAGYVADGVVATTTEINNPRGITVDASGNVYFADMSNNRIREIDAATDIITTVAGNGVAGFAGDGGLAAATTTKINLPTDVKFDDAGNMYIADVSNFRVRMVNTSGIISTIAGGGTTGNAGDGNPATAVAVKIAAPVSMAIMPNPNYYYISDRTSNRIRLVKPNSTPYFTGGARQSLTVCEDAAATSINSLLAIIDSDKSQTETWSAGAWLPLHGTAVISGAAASTGATVTPAGFSYTPTVGYSGMDSFIVQVSDGYNSSTDTIIVTINPLPAVPAITGAAPVCVGANVLLSDATPGGAWSETTGNASVAGGTVTGITAGADVISYAVTNACGTTTVTVNITINPLPDAGTITGPATTVCSGSTITLSDAAPGGVWGASNGNATVAGGVVTGINPGLTDDISYSVTNSCGTDIATATVTIITIPGLGTSIGPDGPVCVGSTITYSSGISGGVWSASNGDATIAGGVVTGVSGGVVTITYALTNTCGTNNLAATVTVNPLPDAGAISGLTSVCVAGAIPLGETMPGGTWSAANGNATVSGTGVVTGVTVGTDVISYSVTNSCGTAVATTTVNIVTVPSAGVITGPPTVCQGGTTTLTDGVPGGVWSAANGNATVAGGVVTGVSGGTDVISYTVTFSCGTATATKAITINPLPVVAAIIGPSTLCIGSSVTFSDGTAGGAWSAANGNATVSGAGLVTGVTAGPDVISYSVTNACGAASSTLAITISPIIAPGISFSASPGFTTCPGTMVAYTANPVNGGASPVYQWKVNGTLLGSGGTFSYTPANGDIIACKLTSSASCLSVASASDTDTVVVNLTLVPSVHIAAGIGGDTVCLGDLSTFTAAPVNGGTVPAYQWNVNGTPFAAGNPFTYAAANGDIVTCLLTSSYACPAPAIVTSNNIAMTVNTTEGPAVSITVSPGNPSCAGAPVTFTAHSLYGGTAPFYRWTKNSVNVATGPEYVYTPVSGDNVYAMMGSNATCRTADTVFSNHIVMETVTDPAMSVNILAPSGTDVAEGQNDTLTAVVTGGSATPTYQWFVNGSAVAGATTSIFVVNGSMAGTEIINCVATSGDACNLTAVSNILSVTINNVGVPQIAGGEEGMKIAPNPNRGTFTMNLAAMNNEQVQVLITNALGEKVKEFNTATNTITEIDLGKAAAGIYFLSATTGNGRYLAKVVVE